MIYTIESHPHPQVKRVLVDGVEVKQAFYADTQKGFVRHYDDPVKIHKYGKRAITRSAHGHVEVELR